MGGLTIKNFHLIFLHSPTLQIGGGEVKDVARWLPNTALLCQQSVTIVDLIDNDNHVITDIRHLHPIPKWSS